LGTAEDLRSAIEDPDLWHPLRGFFLIVKRLMLPLMRPVYELISNRHAKNSRLIVAAPCTALGARVAHDRLGVPLATIHLQPSVLRSVHQTPLLPGLMMGERVPRWLKRAQYGVGDYLLGRRHIEPSLNAFRAELGLWPVAKVAADWWNSPQRVVGLFPDWFAPVQPDWASQVVLTGFPLWDERGVTQPPRGLDEFLAAGSAPIVFTPGSAMLDGEAFFATAVAACRDLSRRAVLLTRYAEQLPRALPADVRHFDFVPLSSLLPRSAAIVHHAGIGTAAQGLAAGIPQLAMPMTYDQPDNADRLARLGVAAVIPRRSFTVRAAAGALEKLLTDEQVAANCRAVSSRFDTPAALRATCAAIESLAW
jgi:UDP:flavonoid glycosyltransferase YjiC (YdhE family)